MALLYASLCVVLIMNCQIMEEEEADALDKLDEASRKQDRFKGFILRQAHKPSSPAIGPRPWWHACRSAKAKATERSLMQSDESEKEIHRSAFPD